MATWQQFATDAPELAEVAARLWPGIVALERGDPPPEPGLWFSISYLATVRRDASPHFPTSGESSTLVTSSDERGSESCRDSFPQRRREGTEDV